MGCTQSREKQDKKKDIGKLARDTKKSTTIIDGSSSQNESGTEVTSVHHPRGRSLDDQDTVSCTSNSGGEGEEGLDSTVTSGTNPKPIANNSFGTNMTRRRGGSNGLEVLSSQQQKVISRGTTPTRRYGHGLNGKGMRQLSEAEEAGDFNGMSPMNTNHNANATNSNSMSESVRWRSCASRFGGTATGMSSALINSQYFYSFATNEDNSPTVPMGSQQGLRIDYGSQQQTALQHHAASPLPAAASRRLSAEDLGFNGSFITSNLILHSPMSPSQTPARRARRGAPLDAAATAPQGAEDDNHDSNDVQTMDPTVIKTSPDNEDGTLPNKPAQTSASGLCMLSPATTGTPATTIQFTNNSAHHTTIHIRTQSLATNASVNTGGGGVPTPRYYGSDDDTPTTTIYHEQLSHLMSGPDVASPEYDKDGQLVRRQLTSGSNGILSPSTTHTQRGGVAESDDGSDHDGSPTVTRLGENASSKQFEAECVREDVSIVPSITPEADTPATALPALEVDMDLALESTTSSRKRRNLLASDNPARINSLAVVAKGTDPASRYVKAKLAMGTQRVKEGKGFDMSAFRVGCDSISVTKKPDYHLYDPATDPLLNVARKRRASVTSTTESPSVASGGAKEHPCGTTNAETSFADLLNPTCTWDLLQSIPDAVAKVNSGDFLYRFCAKKYKDLPLEERVEIASMINMTGFKDELAENDQPILDFVHNKNSVGPTQEGISAASALDATIAKHLEKERKSEGKHVTKSGTAAIDTKMITQNQTACAEVEEIDIDNVLVCVLRLVGIMPRVTSRDANVDCVMNTEFQRLLAAPDEVFEHIDRYRTFRKVKHIIPFVFSFRFQMTGSEVVDEETLAEHAQHHDAKPNRIIVTERTKKNRGADSTIKSKAFYFNYDIPPRGISSITGKPLAPELLQQQNKELSEASERLGGQSPEDIPSQTSGKAKKNKKHSGGKHQSQGQHGNPLQNSSTTVHQMIPEKPGGILCVHTAVIIRTSMPKVLSGMVEALGNKMGKQATGQIFKVRQFLLEKKLGGWPEMESGGDNPDVKFMWE